MQAIDLELTRAELEVRELEARLRVVPMNDAQLAAALERALAAQPRELERYQAGEKKLFGVLLGAVMKELQGKADAALVRQVLQERLR